MSCVSIERHSRRCEHENTGVNPAPGRLDHCRRRAPGDRGDRRADDPGAGRIRHGHYRVTDGQQSSYGACHLERERKACMTLHNRLSFLTDRWRLRTWCAALILASLVSLAVPSRAEDAPTEGAPAE